MFEILFWGMGDFLDLNHENEVQRKHVNNSKYIGNTTIWIAEKSVSSYLAMDWSNNFKNWASEVWYILLTKLISVIRK